jgi:hypothetical protein
MSEQKRCGSDHLEMALPSLKSMVIADADKGLIQRVSTVGAAPLRGNDI